jgi:hypothetical protein
VDGGGEEDSTSMRKTITNGPRSSYPGQHALFKLGQLDDPLPHTEDSEGPAAPRSVTDSTEQWVWCIVHIRLCYMLFRPPQEALVVFGYIEVHVKAIHLIYIGVYPHKYIGHEDNVQTGGVVRVRYMLFNVHLCNHIILL